MSIEIETENGLGTKLDNKVSQPRNFLQETFYYKSVYCYD